MNANIHLVMNSFGTFFPDKIFLPDISLTCFKFPDISRFSRQVVTLYFKPPEWQKRVTTITSNSLKQEELRKSREDSQKVYQTRPLTAEEETMSD